MPLNIHVLKKFECSVEGVAVTVHMGCWPWAEVNAEKIGTARLTVIRQGSFLVLERGNTGTNANLGPENLHPIPESHSWEPTRQQRDIHRQRAPDKLFTQSGILGPDQLSIAEHSWA